MKSIWKVLLVALFMLVACGGQSNNPKQVDPQQAAEPLAIASEQLYRISQPLSMAGVPAPIMIMPFSTGVAPLDTAEWDCSQVSYSGDLTDNDEDGIPVNATYNGRCTWSYSGGEGSMSGYWEFKNLRIQDPNDGDADAGVKASGGVAWGLESDGSSMSIVWTLDKHELIKQGASYTFAFKGNWKVTVGSDVYNFNYDLSGDWTPDDATDPWGDGTMNATGQLSGSGPSCAGWSASFELSGVHFSGNKVVSGTGSYSVTDCDGSSASVTITWSASQVCVTFDNHAVCAPNN